MRKGATMAEPGIREHKLFIDGTWTDGTGATVVEVLNPATEEVIARVPQASTKDVGEAIAAARRAFDDGPWPRTTPRERVAFLERFADAVTARKAPLADLVVKEAGATRTMAEFWVDTPLDYVRWLIDFLPAFRWEEALSPMVARGAVSQGVVVREPVGVVAAITPFNVPILMNVWKLATALATGNTVVLKPSPFAPLEALALAEILESIDLPPGVVNVVTGDVAEGEELTSHPGVDLVSFTGSDVIGSKIMGQAAPSLKRVLLELGGKSPMLVFADADVDRLVPMAVLGFTVHGGQAGGATTRILVEESVHDELVEKVRTFLGFLAVGDPEDPAVMVGPLIRESQRERVERCIARGVEEGATVAFGGGRPAGLERGYFVEPTLFTGVENSMSIAQDEVFGPVGVVIPFRDEDEAVRLANDTRYGLMGGVWSADTVRAYDVARRIRAGSVVVNGGGYMNPAGPFGGYKRSGIGRELGEAGLHEYLEAKTISWDVR